MRKLNRLARNRADIQGQFQVRGRYGMIRPLRNRSRPQNSIIGGATLWVLRDRPRGEYIGVARFFAYLSEP